MSWTEPSVLSAAVEPVAVSTLVARAKAALEKSLPLCWVSGEVSGFKRAASGHCYFDLKDSAAQVACVMYRNRAALIGFELKDGAQVELRVRPAIYEPRGSLQFLVEQGRLAGVGRLYEAFLHLKAKLDAEGLFDPGRKRSFPDYPRSIGLITSPQAAALADMLRVLRDRWPRATIILYPTTVQGASAPRELLAALAAANRRNECDVLIMGRGGGSLEDLWAFNDEALTRAVSESQIPIVSAVGHETDFSLTDFAADWRAPTPTAAAVHVTPERDALIALVAAWRAQLSDALHDRVDRLGERLDRAAERLRGGGAVIAPWRETLLRLRLRLHHHATLSVPARRAALSILQQRLSAATKQASPAALRTAQAEGRLRAAMAQELTARTARLDRARQALALLNPQHVLDRGYALVVDATGQAVTDAAGVSVGSTLRVRVRRGEIDATVTATRAAS